MLKRSDPGYKELRQKVLAEFESGFSAKMLAKKYGITDKTIYNWRDRDRRTAQGSNVEIIPVTKTPIKTTPDSFKELARLRTENALLRTKLVDAILYGK